MKIEKINDNQIRCILTKEDLEQRNIKLSELAYGTDKARRLFNEMLEQAEYECDFNVEDNPLLVEAVPLSSDSILLIVTKSEYPDELDARFSQFTNDTSDDFDDDFTDLLPANSSSSKDIAELLSAARASATAKAATNAQKAALPEDIEITKLFCFDDLESVIRLAHVVGTTYQGANALFKNPADGQFYLVVSKASHTVPEFAHFCSIFSEFGSQANFSVGEANYFKEHYQNILLYDALRTLSQI